MRILNLWVARGMELATAAFTPLRHGEFSHALAPLTILLLAALLAIDTLRSKVPQSR